MSVVNTCPSAAQIVQLTQDLLAAQERESLISHVVGCRECARSLRHFQLSRSFVVQLSERIASNELTLTPEVVELVRGSEDERTRHTPLAGTNPATLEESPRERRDSLWNGVLQPAQQEGELGRLGSYRILKILGTGGMGRVFLAEDTQLMRQVALKVMSPHLIDVPAARERFLREARAAASLRDDHIVTIFQVGESNEVPFLAMELLKGEPLDARLRREGRLSLPDLVRIGREIAEGLATAHAHGFIHRDIKPANLWLEGSDGYKKFKRTKILDFGLARAAQGRASLTSTGQVLGTPHYMAPEQARGEEVDARADLFSLGCVLYRMAAGREPFEGDSVMAVLTALATENPRRISELRSDLPSELTDLIERLLAKKPVDRPTSATEVVAALRNIETAPSVQQIVHRQQAAQDERTVPVTALQIASRMERRRFRVSTFLAALVCIGSAALAGFFLLARETECTHADRTTPTPVGDARPVIRVGILHSISGTLGDSGMSVVDATVLAIEEINARGGVLGHKIEYVLRDAESNAEVTATQAEKLITDDRVSVIFGCWTSAGRKMVKPIVERHNHLLFYPMQFEGMELSRNIVYLGGAPNQQIIPAIRYCYTNLGMRKFFLVGSDYVFPHAVHEIVKDELKKLGATLSGEAYVQLGDPNTQPIVDEIVKTKPDIILNTINGDSNRSFFRTLRRAGITPDRTPTFSFCITEHELRLMGGKDMIGDYAAWDYFMSLPGEGNEEFIRKFRVKYGPERFTSDPMLAGYESVFLWAKAVEKAGSFEPQKVRDAVRHTSIDTIHGELKLDPETLYAWRPFRLGKVVEGPGFEVVWGSGIPIRPEPFLSSRTQPEWEQMLWNLYELWGGRWENGYAR